VVAEALHFVEQHQAALQKLPVAMFSVCMTLAMKNGEKYKPAIQQWVEPVRMILQPVSEGIFKGKLEIKKSHRQASVLNFE
jgi:menaquinone-dependent protoporphyrinogen IX oxidase